MKTAVGPHYVGRNLLMSNGAKNLGHPLLTRRVGMEHASPPLLPLLAGEGEWGGCTPGICKSMAPQAQDTREDQRHVRQDELRCIDLFKSSFRYVRRAKSKGLLTRLTTACPVGYFQTCPRRHHADEATQDRGCTKERVDPSRDGLDVDIRLLRSRWANDCMYGQTNCRSCSQRRWWCDPTNYRCLRRYDPSPKGTDRSV